MVSISGVVISAAFDLPTGATMVATFGVALILSIVAGIMVRRNQPANEVVPRLRRV